MGGTTEWKNRKDEVNKQLCETFEFEFSKAREAANEVCTASARSIYKLIGDSSYVDRIIAFDKEFSSHRTLAYNLQDVLREVPGLETRYLAIILDGLDQCQPSRVERLEERVDIEKGWMELAWRSGDAEARSRVKSLTQSKDALLAKAASEVIDDITVDEFEDE